MLDSSKLDFIFQLIQSFGIISSFIITIYTLIKSNKQQKATNSLLITQYHREIWSLVYQTEELNRIFDAEANIFETPISEKERAFTNMIFLHMSACYTTMKTKACEPIEGLELDMKDILSYPIPKAVWMDVAKFHNKDFVEFVINIS